jgi:hypothetical protein
LCTKPVGTLLAGLEDEIGGRMGIQLQMEQMPSYLAARFTGAGEVEEVWRQYELIAEHCKRTKNTKKLSQNSE